MKAPCSKCGVKDQLILCELPQCPRKEKANDNCRHRFVATADGTRCGLCGHHPAGYEGAPSDEFSRRIYAHAEKVKDEVRERGLTGSYASWFEAGAMWQYEQQTMGKGGR